MFDAPWRALKLLAKKFYLIWHGQEIINIKSLYYSAEYSGLMKILLWREFINFPSGLLFPLMSLGTFLAIKKNYDVAGPVLFIGVLAVTITLFFICSRFRQPLIPVASIFVSLAIMDLIVLLKKGLKNAAAPISLVMAGLIVLNLGGNIDSRENLSQANASIGGAYFHNKDFPNAIRYYKSALEIIPDNISVFENLGVSYIMLDSLNQAEAIYNRGIGLFPQFSQFNYNLGRIAELRKNYVLAMEFYQKSHKFAPEFPPPVERIAYLFERQGHLDSAYFYFNRLGQLVGIDDRLSRKLRSLESRLKVNVKSGQIQRNR